MTSISKFMAAAAFGAAALALASGPASAAIACVGDACWHVQKRFDYPPDANVVIHEDTWDYGPSVTFHEHEGRGYWSGDQWIEF